MCIVRSEQAVNVLLLACRMPLHIRFNDGSDKGAMPVQDERQLAIKSLDCSVGTRENVDGPSRYDELLSGERLKRTLGPIIS